MNDWKTKPSALERGARIGPVGTPSSIIDWPYSRFGTSAAGNSSASIAAESASLPLRPKVTKWSRQGDQPAVVVDAALEEMEAGGAVEIVLHVVLRGSTAA